MAFIFKGTLQCGYTFLRWDGVVSGRARDKRLKEQAIKRKVVNAKLRARIRSNTPLDEKEYIHSKRYPRNRSNASEYTDSFVGMRHRMLLAEVERGGGKGRLGLDRV